MYQIDQAYNWVGGQVIRSDEGQNHEKWAAPSCRSSTTGLLATGFWGSVTSPQEIQGVKFWVFARSPVFGEQNDLELYEKSTKRLHMIN